MFEQILKLIEGNQVLLTGLGLGGAGILTFWLKDVPAKIFGILKRELTTSVTITSQNVIFYKTLKWIQIKFKDKNFRYLKISNGRWGSEDNTTFSIGYGFHFIWFKNTLFFLRLEKDEANQTEYDKESIILTKFGRSKKVFEQFLEEVEKQNQSGDTLKFYKFNDCWEWLKDINKRDLSTIFIEKEKKEQIIQRIESFQKAEGWYHDKGIPYQLGILLYGPPGTGKTSLIRAIASYLNYPIYYIPTTKMIKLEEAFERLKEKSIVVIEDIDCQTFTHSREDEEDDDEKPLKTKQNENNKRLKGLKSDLGLVGLSEILNTLDGFAGVDGRILIATTNHIEKLDQALIRPGRFDMKIEIGYVNKEILQDFFKNFFPSFKKDFSRIKVKEKLSVATLQEMVLKNYKPEQILKEITL